jgi:hypothetical protein
VYGLLEEGLKSAKDGKEEEAVLAFDKVLARQPMLDRRVDMVPAYVTRAQKLEAVDVEQSLALLRKAERLAPQGPHVPAIRAELAYLEGKGLLSRGLQDPEPFQRALAFDPAHAGARAELERLESLGEQRSSRTLTVAAAVGALLLALVGLVLFAGRGPRRPARQPSRS